jgi:hypothetical protein
MLEKLQNDQMREFPKDNSKVAARMKNNNVVILSLLISCLA